MNLHENETVLTIDQIQGWQYLYETPAGGRLYFSVELDMCAVIYQRVTKLFYGRNRIGFTPHCFNEMREIHRIE